MTRFLKLVGQLNSILTYEEVMERIKGVPRTPNTRVAMLEERLGRLRLPAEVREEIALQVKMRTYVAWKT